MMIDEVLGPGYIVRVLQEPEIPRNMETTDCFPVKLNNMIYIELYTSFKFQKFGLCMEGFDVLAHPRGDPGRGGIAETGATEGADGAMDVRVLLLVFSGPLVDAIFVC